MNRISLLKHFWIPALFLFKTAGNAALINGDVVDNETGRPIPCRISIEDQDHRWFFPKVNDPGGSAIRYEKRNGANTNAVEMHVTLSASPFSADLAPGRYTIRIEHGKEYLPLTRELNVSDQPLNEHFRLKRWVDMAARGWFSGDTHTHRDPKELPNVVLAEDVNVTMPMVYWTTDSDVTPNQSTHNFQGQFNPQIISVDDRHVIYPRNTEYEIFSVAKQSHTLGALVLINHKTVLDLPVLPVSRVAERIHAEGGLIDLEKHNWPWTMAIVPVVKPDLYELANNHFWETEFAVRNWAEPAPAWMNIGTGTATEREWMLYGFQNYYALLDCGFRLQPAAGTANGVHPVPLGFSRVYVELPEGFSYDAWMKGLKDGRSFVTTGPMLLVKMNGQSPGYVFRGPLRPDQTYHLEGTALSEEPLESIEIIVNGRVVRKIVPTNRKTEMQSYESPIQEELSLDGSCWVAIRCVESRPQRRLRFAHTSPFHIEVPGKPLRPRHEEIDFLVQRTRKELDRSRKLLSPEAIRDYEEALRIYAGIAETAR